MSAYTLNQWAFIDTPELGPHVIGKISGHPKYPEGALIRTSIIVSRVSKTEPCVVTQSGSCYRLGTLHFQNDRKKFNEFFSRLPSAAVSVQN